MSNEDEELSDFLSLNRVLYSMKREGGRFHMLINQILTKLKSLIYSKSETDSLLNGKASSSHTHTKSEITDFPAYGTAAGTICQGNDSRLSDARTPYFANNTWYAVGDDVAIGDHNVGGGLGVIALNSTTTRIDFCYKDNAANYKSITYDGTTLYMNGNCDYATSAGGVAWSNVSGRPTAVSQFTNDAGFWSPDGGTWNPNANISLTASGSNQEWSFDILQNGNSGCYWHVWSDVHGSMLRVDADNGAVSIPKNILYLGSYKVYVG